MNETLKGVAHIGAELAAVKADLQRELERHRKTWRQLEQVTGLLRSALPHACHRRDIQNLDTPDGYAYASGLQLLIDNIDAALSQQAEPTDTYTAVDMATAAAQAFRDGQAAVEQDTAQDEREAFAPEIYRANDAKDGQYLGPVVLLIEHNRAVEQARAARPAQTGQQPVQAVHIGWDYLDDGTKVATFLVRCSGNKPPKLYAAPIAQTVP